MHSRKKNLGLIALTTLVISGIVGSGIFSLPQNMAEGAGAGAILIAWGITLLGMLTLTRIFQYLAVEFHQVNEGLYGYIRKGFGDYIGFNVAWGYWISAVMACASYLVILFSALGSFDTFKFFDEGTTWQAILGSLILVWGMHLFLQRGIHFAAMLSSILTLAKIVPITLFIFCLFLGFKVETFQLDFWGTVQLGSVLEQVKHTMLYTVWVYLGIESATVYASRAKHSIDVSRATFLGFLFTSILLVCVSVLSLGIVPQHELMAMKNPSMALVLERIVGPWGRIFINIALIISVSGALLAWMMLSCEMLYLTGKGEKQTNPSSWGILNHAGTPKNALWLTSISLSVLLILAFFYQSGYNKLIQLSTSMVLLPYLLSAMFVLKLAIKKRNRSLTATSLIGTFYGIWLIYASGLSFLLLSMILYSLGLVFYIKARRERAMALFGHWRDKLYAVIIILLGFVAMIYFFT